MKEKKSFELNDRRLKAAASFARPGKRFADIGTDHAYLPVYLCGSGIAPGGVASDIGKGPLARAGANIRASGMEDKISARLADGLDGVAVFSPEDIYVLGMGGELIARILGASEYIKQSGIRLILQPMTHPQDLRKYLVENGFSIDDELIVTDKPVAPDTEVIPLKNRIYQIICARFTGKSSRTSLYAGYPGIWDLEGECKKETDGCSECTRSICKYAAIEQAAVPEKWSDAELMLGKINISGGGVALRNLASRYAKNCETAIRGLEAGGLDSSAQKALLEELVRISKS